MADEKDTPKTPEVDPEEQHAKEHLKKLEERYGTPAKVAAEEEPKAEVKPEKEPAASPKPKPDSEAESEKKSDAPSPSEIERRYKERESRRKEREELEELRRTNEEIRRYLEEAFSPPEQTPTPQPEEVDFSQDPQGWYERKFEETLDQKLGPIRARMEAEEEARSRAEWMRHQQAQHAARFEAGVKDLQTLEEEYDSSPEGKGYRQRVDAYARNQAKALQDSGVPDEAIPAVIMQEMGGLLQQAAQLGKHPAQWVDARIRNHPYAQALSDVDDVGEGTPQDAEAPSEPTTLAPKQGVVQSVKKAAESTSAGTLGAGGRAEPSGDADVKAAVKRGKITVGDLKKMTQGLSRGEIRERLKKMEALADAKAKAS